MGIPASIGVGFAGGAALGAGIYLINSDPPRTGALGVGLFTGAAGAVTGLATGIAAKKISSPVVSALVGTAATSVIPASFLVAAKTSTGGNGGWDDLVYAVTAIMTGVGVAGGGAALLGRALLRR